MPKIHVYEGPTEIYEYIKHNGEMYMCGFYCEYFDSDKLKLKIDTSYALMSNYTSLLHGRYKEYYYNKYDIDTEDNEDNNKEIYTLIKDCYYEYGVKHGEYKTYYLNGFYKKVCEYYKCKQYGEVRYYYENSRRKLFYTCNKKGYYDGKYVEYHI